MDDDDITASVGTSHGVHCMLEAKFLGRCRWNDSTAASAPLSPAMLSARAAALEATWKLQPGNDSGRVGGETQLKANFSAV